MAFQKFNKAEKVEPIKKEEIEPVTAGKKPKLSSVKPQKS